jgi:hypothetical protein
MTSVTVDLSKLADPVWRKLMLTLGRRSAGTHSGSSVVDWAVEAMLGGWDSLSLAVLAGLPKPPNEFEVDRCLTSMAAELKLDLPHSGAMPAVYAAAIAHDVVSCSLSPYEGSRELRRLWLATGCPVTLSAWSGLEDKFELARDGYFRVADVERDIVEEARRLLGQA